MSKAAIPLLVVIGALASVSGCRSAGADGPPVYPIYPKVSYVTYASLDPVKSLTVAGKLRIPADRTGILPAVVIVHGSAGIDSRGSYYAQALNEAGIATLEIDMWAARGLIGGAAGRPRSVPETLPDAYGALKFLAAQPGIDPKRIGIMGFSWGGVVSMLTATQPYTDQYIPPGESLKFAAHAPFYPVCWVYTKVPGYAFNAFTSAPVFIQAGELDTYDDPDSCPKLAAGLPPAAQAYISAKVYQGATHAFNRLEPPVAVTDPFSHKGAGGNVDFIPNPQATLESRAATVRFFKTAFGLPN